MTIAGKIWDTIENINWLNISVWILFPIVFWGVLIWILFCVAGG